jgi:hypothetical protein
VRGDSGGPPRLHLGLPASPGQAASRPSSGGHHPPPACCKPTPCAMQQALMCSITNRFCAACVECLCVASATNQFPWEHPLAGYRSRCQRVVPWGLTTAICVRRTDEDNHNLCCAKQQLAQCTRPGSQDLAGAAAAPRCTTERARSPPPAAQRCHWPPGGHHAAKASNATHTSSAPSAAAWAATWKQGALTEQYCIASPLRALAAPPGRPPSPPRCSASASLLCCHPTPPIDTPTLMHPIAIKLHTSRMLPMLGMHQTLPIWDFESTMAHLGHAAHVGHASNTAHLGLCIKHGPPRACCSPWHASNTAHLGLCIKTWPTSGTLPTLACIKHCPSGV